MNTHFNAPWGLALKVLSAITLGITVLLVLALTSSSPPAYSWLIIAILASLPLFMVRGYAVEGGELRIARPLWTTTVGLDELVEVSTDKDEIKSSLRAFGNGGGFSFTGFYWSRKLGFCRVFANNFDGVAVLKFRNRRPVVLGPENAEQFATDLRQLRGLA